MTKTWGDSQEYEMKNAIKAMNKTHFKSIYKNFIDGKLSISKGYIANNTTLKEFFDDSQENWFKFINYVSGKVCLEIGPCIVSELVCYDVASERHVIEPLYLKIREWQIANLGRSTYEDLICYGQGAENTIDGLIGLVNGAIFCRNMLDHTPHWEVVLTNISNYATKGCRLLLWTDLYHKRGVDIGHYNITTNLSTFKELIKDLGFRVIREYQDVNRIETLNYGCFAIKE